MEGFGHRFRHVAVAADGGEDLIAEKVDANQVLVLGPGHVVALENEIVKLGIEPALLVGEGRRGLELLPDAEVRRAQPELGCLRVQQVLADQKVEHLAREPGLVGLVAGQIGAAGAVPLALQGALKLAVEEDRGNVDVAHRRHRRTGCRL